jgi:endonuclease/exonuclease/phosphatase family metal-dependent hydrolase
VEDRIGSSRIFSRDCPEYAVRLPSGETLWVLVNHLKSKGYGSFSESNKRRRQQAARVRAIYEARRKTGAEFVAVLGDLNDTPPKEKASPLWPLLANGSDLVDVQALPFAEDGGHPGTYRNGSRSQKLDYLLLSPALRERVTAAGVFRKGVWGNKDGKRWPIYDEIKMETDAASDHAAIWAEIDLD